MPINDQQTFNKQHAVPQNIMDVEFKIIGELTLRQFAYIIVFGGIAYICATFVSGIFRWPLTVTFALLGIGLAFVPLQERGLDQWIVNFFTSVYAPNQRIWKKDAVTPAVFLYQNMAVLKQELITLAPTSSRRKLEAFLNQQESREIEDKLDIPENYYLKFTRDYFAQQEAASGATTTTTTYEVDQYVSEFIPTGFPVDQSNLPPVEPEKKLEEKKPEAWIEEQKPVETPHEEKIPEFKQTIPQEKEEKQPEPVAVEKPQVVEQTIPDIKPQPIPPLSQKQDIPAQPKPEIQTQVHLPQKEIIQPKPQPPILEIKPKPVPEQIKPEIKTEVTPPVSEKPKIIKPSHELHLPGRKENDVVLSPLTPDRHSGRRFTSLLPKQGEIILPIRGQKVLKTSEDMQIERDLMEKTEQLNKLIQNIKISPEYTQNIPQEKEQKEPPVQKPVQPEQKQPEVKKGTPKEWPKKHEQPKETRIEAPKPQPQQPKPAVQVHIPVEPLKPSVQPQSTYAEIVENTELKTAHQPTPTKPNVLAGTIRGNDSTGLPGVVVIIKNERGETVRALKTNSFGQFSLVTPLINGKYLIEVDSTKKTDYSFGIISVEAKGEVIAPLEIAGK